MNGGADDDDCKSEEEECTIKPPGFSECCKGLKCEAPHTLYHGDSKYAIHFHTPITVPGFKGECVHPKESAEDRKRITEKIARGELHH